LSPGVLRKQAYLIWAEKTITPATLWASLPLSFSLLSFLFLPKGIPEIERKRLFAITSSSLNFRDDSCFCWSKGVVLPELQSPYTRGKDSTMGDTPIDTAVFKSHRRG